MSKVTVIIPARKKAALTRQCLKSIRSSGAYEQAELDVIVIEQGGQESKIIVDRDFPDAARWMEAGDDWNFSQMNNAAAKESTGDYLLLLNNDTICRWDFLKEMLRVMDEHPEVGIVGAKLLFLDGRIQHIGVAFSSAGVPYHMCWGRQDDGTVAAAIRDDYYDAVTFACALIRRSVWDELQGLDEIYHFNFDDVDFCLRAREAGYRCMVAHKAILVHLEGQTIGTRIRDKDAVEKHGLVPNLKIFIGRWLKDKRFSKATGLPLDANATSIRHDRMNLAFIPQGKDVGVPWWRVERPARMLAKLGLANVQMLYPEQGTDRLIAALENADVAVFQGFCSEWVWRIASMGPKRNFKMVYDYDDHPLHISPFAQAYRYFGTQEIKIRKGDQESWLWRDGEGHFDIARNMENRQRQLEIFHMVDLVTTSTPPLYRYFKTLNPNVVLLPNQVDFDVYQTPLLRWQRKMHPSVAPLCIGWHGGDNHFHDVETIGRPLTEFANANKVEICLFGAYYRGAFRGIQEGKIREEEWVHVEAFPYKLAGIGIDVAVIPLANPSDPMMRFNEFKSNIKFLEYAALRVPALVVEGRSAYAGCEDNGNCLTYSSPEEFTEKLGLLCSDDQLRRRLGAAAHEYAREHFDLEKNAHRWVDAYENIQRREWKEAEEPEADREAASSAVAEGAPA